MADAAEPVQPPAPTPALQRIAEMLEDGEGPTLDDLLAGEGFYGRVLSAAERRQLSVIASWARL